MLDSAVNLYTIRNSQFFQLWICDVTGLYIAHIHTRTMKLEWIELILIELNWINLSCIELTYFIMVGRIPKLCWWVPLHKYTGSCPSMRFV